MSGGGSAGFPSGEPADEPIIRHGRRWIEEFPASPLRWLLTPLWLPWRAVVALRGVAYDRRWAAIHRVDAPVLSIGNLTAGGTGKTPVALAVVARLRAAGRRPAIVARGYRGLGAGSGVNDEAMLAGDIPVVCDPDRVAGARRALAQGADCVVLDDGFQHRRLARDADIVVIDATRPWGGADGGRGALLPLGYRREGLGALRRADLFWLTRGDLVPPERLAAIRARLAGRAPVVEERLTGATLTPLAGGAAVPAATWHSRPVVLASGIGNPAGFTAAARWSGLTVVESHRFPDHHGYTAADVARLAAAAAKHGAPLVVTGKDAVKLRGLMPADVETQVLGLVTGLVDPAPLDALIARVLGR